MTQDEEGWGIYRDGRRMASYPASLLAARPYMLDSCATATAIAAWSFVTAEQAPVAAWWERLEGSEERWRVVVDAKPVDDVVCDKPWLKQPPELSADGRHVAYACPVTRPLARVLLVADGRRHGPYLDVWGYAWSDDGAHVVYGGAAEDAPPARLGTTTSMAWHVPSRSFSVWRPRVEAGTGRLAWQRNR
jgi:hypothetical protein